MDKQNVGNVTRAGKKDDIYSYHILDARKIDEKLNRKIVDVVITSPPYYNLKDYNIDGQIGHGQSYEEYLDDLENIFCYCSNIVKDTGSLWIVVDTFKQNGEMKLLPFDLAKRIESKWILQDIVIWIKDKNLPWSHKGRLRNMFEYILFFTKRGQKNFKYYIDRIRDTSDLKEWWIKYPERYNPKGKNPSNVWEIYSSNSHIWRIPIPVQGSWGKGWIRHSCPFPPKLVERILLLTTDEGDVVLDPFAGSGIVLAQAKVMNRKAIGFDINEEFKKMYEERVYPEIKRLWKVRVKELKKEKDLQRKLEDTLKKLKKLKYPKELIKQILKNGLAEIDFANLNSIFVLDDEKKLFTPSIYLVFNNLPSDKSKNIISTIQRVMSRKPLSSYGFIPTVHIMNRDDFIKKIKIPSYLYLYIKGDTTSYNKTFSFSDWIKESHNKEWKMFFQNGIPPILSNIRVNVKDFYFK